MIEYEPVHKIAIFDVPEIAYRTWVLFSNLPYDECESAKEMERQYPYDERNEHIGY